MVWTLYELRYVKKNPSWLRYILFSFKKKPWHEKSADGHKINHYPKNLQIYKKCILKGEAEHSMKNSSTLRTNAIKPELMVQLASPQSFPWVPGFPAEEHLSG